MRQSIVISIFSFIISFVIALVYWILRIGFLDNSIFIVLKVLGISSFLLFLPIALEKLLKKKKIDLNKGLLNDTIIPIYGIIILAGFGFISPILNINFSIVFILLGFLLLGITFYAFVKKVLFWQRFLLIIMATFFAIWVASVCWYLYLKPLFFEGLAFVGENKIDTFYHMAIAQMIKTYGIPSTGIDGIPYMNYHCGSHWIFAQFSNLLNIPVMTIYQLGFPVIFAPLLFRTFLSFVIEVKKYYKPEVDLPSLNIFFWIIFLAVFIGFIINFVSGSNWAQFASGGTGLYLFMLLSESYTLSITLMLAIMAICISFWIHKENLSLIQQSLFLFFLLPILIVFLGFLKISTMFVVCCLIFYLFLRLRLFKILLFNITIFIILLALLLVSKIVFESKEDHGSFYFFYFYKQFNISLIKLLVLQCSWTILFIIVYILKENLYKLSSWQINWSNKLLPIESILILTLAGFTPTILLKINNCDSLYFTEIQMWLGSTLVLVYIPFYSHYKIPLKRFLFLSLICITLFFIFFINTKTYLRAFLFENTKTRQSFTNGRGHVKERILKTVLSLNLEEIQDILKDNSHQIQKKYSDNKVLSFLQKLKELDKIPIEEKRKTLVYVDFRTLVRRNDYKWSIPCYNIPFLVPSISGMASIEGIDITYFDCGTCCGQAFGYEYFEKWKNMEELNKIHTISDLCTSVHREGFERLIYFNIKTELFEKINCTN